MQSIWKQTSTSPEAYQKSRESETETIVIGAGMAGILTAWFLQAQGSPVIVLEANTVGSGQTGNTTAKITSQHGLIYQKLLSSFGIEKAAQYARANKEAIANYQKLAKELEIDCGFEVHPAFLYTSRDADPLKREEEAAQKAGIRASFLRETELPFPVTGALRFENQAWFHPLKFLYALAGKLPVYEYARVLRVDGNRVETTSGTFTGKNIVFATHYPFINRPGYYFMRMHQERSYAIAVEGAPKMDGMYLGIDPDGLSLRNFEDLLLVGGEGHRTGENHIGGQYGRLYKKAEEYWPGIIEKARWSAQDCMTLDGVPYIGRYSENRPDWYVATGFGKWGMTSSMIAAKLLSGEILQIRDRNREIFSPQRSALQASAENFLKDSIHAGKDLLRYMFQNPTKEITELLPGHGGIVEYDGKKAGVYKDEEENIFLVSVRCPHLGCQLEWNPQEKSWDCPCHGSRFDYHGTLIDNPAQEDLQHE